jgi:hypothetical protein
VQDNGLAAASGRVQGNFPLVAGTEQRSDLPTGEAQQETWGREERATSRRDA